MDLTLIEKNMIETKQSAERLKWHRLSYYKKNAMDQLTKKFYICHIFSLC